MKPKPLLKWVGGKRQLLPVILSKLPKHPFGTYHEPFFGGGAVFWALEPERAVISDYNRELIHLYQMVQEDELCHDFTNDLRDMSVYYHSSTDEDREKFFYQIRNLDRSPEWDWDSCNVFGSYRAARTVFLNKTCFNGLYRVNKKGEFNSPFGKYKNPNICDEANISLCHDALQKMTIEHQSFEKVLDRVEKGDFVYLDPPYVPLTVTSNFTAYTSDGFGLQQQELLYDICGKLSQKGVFWLQSNSSAPWILERYKEFFIDMVDARRSINCDAEKRGTVKEVLIHNYP